jgi:phosphoserine phosphatase
MKSPVTKTRKASRTTSWELHEPGWTDRVRMRLEALIKQGAGQGLPVVFDFDNTIVCGDIGEATLAVLARSGLISLGRLPASFFPSFRTSSGNLVTIETSADLAEYYEAFLAPTAHGSEDPTPLANGYALAAEVLQGLNPYQVVEATRTAYELGNSGEVRLIEVTPGRTAYPAPYFYSEMVELLAKLLSHDFDVWIVSASNVWSVRWMLLEALPPLMRARGVRRSIRPDHIVGISTLLSDGDYRLYKDPLLVRELPPYARLERVALERFKLTSRLQFPVSTYSGKIACILDHIGRPPYLCAGDSPGDIPMMKFSENRLWIARLEKPSYQRVAVRAVRETEPSRWLCQPALNKRQPGFVSAQRRIPALFDSVPNTVDESLRIWRGRL